jgi:hypothetical protein
MVSSGQDSVPTFAWKYWEKTRKSFRIADNLFGVELATFNIYEYFLENKKRNKFENGLSNLFSDKYLFQHLSLTDREQREMSISWTPPRDQLHK